MISIRTRSTRARLSRRAFIRGVGASAAVLPLLDAGRARAVADGERILRNAAPILRAASHVRIRTPPALDPGPSPIAALA